MVLEEMLKEERKEGREEGRELGREEGRVAGRTEGQAAGRTETLRLVSILSQAGRTEDILKAAEDPAYQQKLFEEFGL